MNPIPEELDAQFRAAFDHAPVGMVRGNDIPAIALTAYARPEDRVHAVDAGYQTHLAKPADPSELIALVADLAGRSGTRGHDV